MSILLKVIKFAPTQHFLTTYSFYKLTGHRVKGGWVGGGEEVLMDSQKVIRGYPS